MTKRTHKRFSITGVATLQIKDGEKTKTIQGILGSISFAGMGLYADKPIEANKQISIAIHFISIGGGIKNCVIEGTVVYSKDLGKIHFVGIQFNEAVNSKNHTLLYEHIQNIHSFEK